MNNEHCNFFVQRKKRFCKMSVKSGEKFCAEHQTTKNTSNEEDKNRISCPLDPKHTCFASKLDAHLKVCNSRPKESPPYIVKNCNIDQPQDESEKSNKRPLSSISKEDLLTTIKVIEDLYVESVDGNISSFVEKCLHSTVKDEAERIDRAHSTKRHLYQTSAILNIIEDECLSPNGTCFVELGAGKGHLSFYLANMLPEESNCSVLLVDKASHRHKQDNKLTKDCLQVHRIRADISDLMMSEVEFIKKSTNVVGVSKHLCGAATDLALKCLTNRNILGKTCGMVMATCCHHRCGWDSYVGKDFLMKRGIDKCKFDIITGLVSWATCGTGLSREKTAQLNIDHSNEEHKKVKYEQSDEPNKKTENINSKISASANLGLNQTQREDIGYKAKHVLDWGRLVFLTELGFECKLNYYVTKEVSPENVCMIVKKSVTS